MKMEILFELLEQSNSVSSIRRLIYGLACQGRLTRVWRDSHPDVSDGTKVLAQIKKERLAWAKSAKGQEFVEAKRTMKIVEEIQFNTIEITEQNIPNTWTWTHLINACHLIVDCHNKTAPYSFSGIPLVRTSDCSDGQIDFRNTKFVDEKIYTLWSKRCIPMSGDIIFTREAPMGQCGIIPKDGKVGKVCLGQRTMLLRLFSHLLIPEYLRIVIMDPAFQERIHAVAVGMTVKHLRVSDVEKLILPIPPVEEQHIIVSTVGRLMKFCDEFEFQQKGKQEARQRLNSRLIDRLVDSQDAAEFDRNWQQLRDQFDVLYDHPDAIDKLREAIRELGVQGKLNRMKTRENDHKLTTFGGINIKIESGWSPNCENRPKEGSEWGVLKVSAVSWGTFLAEENKALPANLEVRSEHEVKLGDFLMSRANTAELVGRSVVVTNPTSRLILSDKILRVKFKKNIDSMFVNLLFSTRSARSHFFNHASGTSTSMKNISREIINAMPVTIPSLSAQRLIVAKVNDLMAICDTLEARLKDALRIGEALLTSTIHHLLDPATKAPEPAPAPPAPAAFRLENPTSKPRRRKSAP